MTVEGDRELLEHDEHSVVKDVRQWKERNVRRLTAVQSYLISIKQVCSSCGRSQTEALISGYT